MRLTFIALILTLIAACSPANLEKTILTPQEQALVRAAVDDVSRGDSASLSKKMPPELARTLPSAVNAMHSALPPKPFELSLANANWTTDGAVRNARAVYQVRGKGAWALVEATMQSASGKMTLTGIYVQQTTADPRHLNEFSLDKAGVGGWAMIFAMAAAVAVTIAAVIRVWRSGRFRRRWLWTIGALVGVMTLRINWSTGEFSFQPISVQIFSISAFKQPVFAPWVLAVSLPLVAILALLWRRDRETEDASASETPSAETN